MRRRIEGRISKIPDRVLEDVELEAQLANSYVSTEIVLEESDLQL